MSEPQRTRSEQGYHTLLLIASVVVVVAGMRLAGVATSGYFVRSGRSPSVNEIAALLDLWAGSGLPERLREPIVGAAPAPSGS